MKQLSKPHMIPALTLVAGFCGMALELWLFAGADSKGLLPRNHPAELMMLILCILCLPVIYLASRRFPEPVSAEIRYPASRFGAAGQIAGVLCLLFMSFHELQKPLDILGMLSIGLSLLSGLSLLGLAYNRLKGQKVPAGSYCLLCLYTMIHAICQYRSWRCDAQLMNYAFPLFTSVFIMIYCYFRAVEALKPGNAKAMVFFNQIALLCSLIAAGVGRTPVSYLLAAFWLTADLGRLPEKEEG